MHLINKSFIYQEINSVYITEYMVEYRKQGMQLMSRPTPGVGN